MRARGLATMLAAWLLVMAGCTAGSSSSPPVSLEPIASDTTTSGPYRLSFETDRVTYAEDDVIDAVASLIATDGHDHEVCGAIGGLFGYSFVEVGGTRHMDAVRDYGAAPYTIPADAPLTSHLHKSGGYTPDDPNAGFYQQWLDDPALRLPQGTWDIKAWVQLFDGDCNDIGPNDVRDLWTTIRVVVTR
jgi:hypothetical protein